MRIRRRKDAVRVGGASLVVELPLGWVEIPVAAFTDPADARRKMWAATTAQQALGAYVQADTLEVLASVLAVSADTVVEEKAVWAAAWLPTPKAGMTALARVIPVGPTGGPPDVELLAADARADVPADTEGERTVEIVRLPAGESVRVAGAVRAVDAEGNEGVIESVEHVLVADAAPVAVRLRVTWIAGALGDEIRMEADELAEVVRVAPAR